MPLEPVLVPIKFGQGLNTKTDPKNLIPGEMVTLENVLFVTPTEYVPRSGYEALSNAFLPLKVLPGGNITSGIALANFASSLVLLDGQQVYSYSETSGDWDQKGKKETVSLSVTPVTGNIPGATPTSQDTCVNGNLLLVSWLTFSQNNSSGKPVYLEWYSILDVATKQPVANGIEVNAGVQAKCVAIGSNFIYLTQGNFVSHTIQPWTIAPTDPTNPLVGSPLVNVSTTQDVPFDVCSNSTDFFLFYLNTSNNPALTKVDNTLSVVSTISLGSESATSLNVAYDSGNNYIWIFWYTGTSVKYAIYDTSLTQILAPTVVDTKSSITRIGSVVNNSLAEVFYEQTGSSPYLNVVNHIQVDTVGGNNFNSLQRNCSLASKPFFTSSGALNCVLLHDSTLQPTYFLTKWVDDFNGTPPEVVSKLAPLEAGPTPTLNSLPFVVNISSNVFEFPYFNKINTTIVSGVVQSSLALGSAKFDFNQKSTTLSLANNLQLNGGQISVYDGANTVEQNFNLFPENLSIRLDTNGGGLQQGTYGYIGTYEWTDNYGQIQRSAPSVPLELVIADPIYSGLLNSTDPHINVAGPSVSDFVYVGMAVSAASGISPGTIITGFTSSTSIAISSPATASVTEPITYTPRIQGTASSTSDPTKLLVNVPPNKFVTGSTTASNSHITVDDLRGLKQTLIYTTNNGYIPASTSGSFFLNNTIALSANANTTASNIAIQAQWAFNCSFISGMTTVTSSIPVDNTFIGRQVYAGGTVTSPHTFITAILSSTTFTISHAALSTASGTTFIGFFPSEVYRIGQTITGSNIPANTTIVGFDDLNSLLILSNPIDGGISFTDEDISVTNNYETVLQFPNINLTQKPAGSINLVLYRTQANQTVYFKVASAIQNFDDFVDFTTIYDQLSDAEIVGNQQLYTNGGELENISPPASDITCIYKNRIILVPSENALTWWPSKQVTQGLPVEFSDQLAQQMDQTGGPITAIAAMDDKLIFFKQNTIFYVVGTGPSNAGTNNDFSYPQLITTDQGCINQSSIAICPYGLLFKSNNGIYLLDRSLQVRWIGDKVAKFNSFNITSANLIPKTTTVRFTLDNGTLLHYDYYVNDWSVHTNISAVDSTIYKNALTYLDSSGIVHEETPGVYSDNGSPIIMKLITGWLNFAGYQGFQRFYEMLIGGDYLSPHNLTISLAYDFNTSDTQSNLIPVPSDPQPYQFRLFPKIQKCESVRITLIVSPTDTTGGGANITAFNCKIGAKKGNWKLSAARSYG